MKLDAQKVFIIAIASIVAVAGILVLLNNYIDNDSNDVRYYGNGGTTSDGKTDFSDASNIVLENPFSYDGHTFLCWNTELDGSGEIYSRGNYANGISLYAQWAPKPFSMVINYTQTDGPDTINTSIKDANGVRDVAVSSVVTEDMCLGPQFCKIAITSGSWTYSLPMNPFSTNEEYIFVGTIDGKTYDIKLVTSGLLSTSVGLDNSGPSIKFDFISGYSHSLSIELKPHVSSEGDY